MRCGSGLAIAATLAACGAPAPDAVVAIHVDDRVLGTLGAREVRVVERYVRSTPRWEVVEESRGALGSAVRYAVRKTRRADPGGEAVPNTLGGWESSSGGLYEGDGPDAELRLQTRVVLGLGREVGFGGRAALLRRAPSAGRVSVPLRRNEGQPPLWDSYVVVRGGGGLTLEVYEESTRRERVFTQRTLRAVCDELRAALAHGDAILAQGRAAALEGDAPSRRGAPFLEVSDGIQPGIYVVTAWVNPGTDGRTFVRARFVGPDPTAPAALPPDPLVPGAALSTDRSTPRTVRAVGWGPDPTVLFPYQVEYTVYEGDWQHRYRATFELWFAPAGGGPERKLAETTRTIAGWMR